MFTFDQIFMQPQVIVWVQHLWFGQVVVCSSGFYTFLVMSRVQVKNLQSCTCLQFHSLSVNMTQPFQVDMLYILYINMYQQCVNACSQQVKKISVLTFMNRVGSQLVNTPCSQCFRDITGQVISHCFLVFVITLHELDSTACLFMFTSISV